MEKLLYKSNEEFVPLNFDIRHSILKIKSVETDLIIKFLGTSYMEMPRIFYGLEILELNNDEIDKLLLYKKNIDRNKTNFIKILSNQETYYFAVLSVRVSPAGPSVSK